MTTNKLYKGFVVNKNGNKYPHTNVFIIAESKDDADEIIMDSLGFNDGEYKETDGVVTELFLIDQKLIKKLDNEDEYNGVNIIS